MDSTLLPYLYILVSGFRNYFWLGDTTLAIRGHDTLWPLTQGTWWRLTSHQNGPMRSNFYLVSSPQTAPHVSGFSLCHAGELRHQDWILADCTCTQTEAPRVRSSASDDQVRTGQRRLKSAESKSRSSRIPISGIFSDVRELIVCNKWTCPQNGVNLPIYRIMGISALFSKSST